MRKRNLKKYQTNNSSLKIEIPDLLRKPEEGQYLPMVTVKGKPKYITPQRRYSINTRCSYKSNNCKYT